MAATQVQQKTYASSTQSTSHSITFDSAITQNNLLILCVVADAVATTPAGWSVATSAVDFTGSYIYYKVAGAGESTTVSITIGASSHCCIQGFEYSGCATSSPLDVFVSATAQGGGSSASPGTTSSTSQANELAVGLVGLGLGLVNVSVTAWDNSFVQENQIASTGTGTLVRSAVATKTLSSIGTVTYTTTLSTAASNQCALLATFKANNLSFATVAWIIA